MQDIKKKVNENHYTKNRFKKKKTTYTKIYLGLKVVPKMYITMLCRSLHVYLYYIIMKFNINFMVYITTLLYILSVVHDFQS